MSTVLYVLGAPGVGKTTLVRNLLGFKSFDVRSNMYDVAPPGTVYSKPKWTMVPGGLCAGGHYLGKPFDGGDTVPYTEAIECLGYWLKTVLPNHKPVLTILDGDRFSTQTCLDFLRVHRPHFETQVRVLDIHLVASPEALLARRLERELVTKKSQKASWVKGRETKARNFAEKLRRDDQLHCIDLNGDFTTERSAERVKSIVAWAYWGTPPVFAGW